MDVAQLAERLALKRAARRGQGTASAAAPAILSEPAPRSEEQPAQAVADTAQATPEVSGVEPQESQLPTAVEQSPPAGGADPNALWNTDGAETAPAAETEGTEAETETATEGAEEPKAVRKLQKRVNTLTAELRTTQEALRKVNEVAAAKAAEASSEPAPASGSWINQVPEVKAAEAELATLNEHLDWVRANPEGGEYTDRKSGAKQTFDEAQVRRIREAVELRRAEVIAEKAGLTAQLKAQDATMRQRFEGEFRAAYGNLDRGTSPESQEFQAIVTMAPWIRGFPNWKLVVGDAIRGRLAREAALKRGKGTPNGQRQPAPVAARPVAGAAAVDPGQRALRQAADGFQKSGRAEDLAKVIAARRAAGRAR
jgi:hypothetical protein